MEALSRGAEALEDREEDSALLLPADRSGHRHRLVADQLPTLGSDLVEDANEALKLLLLLPEPLLLKRDGLDSIFPDGHLLAADPVAIGVKPVGVASRYLDLAGVLRSIA
jgi:hypothetical protein